MLVAEPLPPVLNAVRHPQLGRVVAVIVTFRCGSDVAANLDAIGREADSIVVVDNGSDEDTLSALRDWATVTPERCRLIENGANIGLAAAQNRGITAAMQEGANWIWLFDHDSQPHAGTLDAFARVEEAAPGCFDLLAPRILHAEFGRIAAVTQRTGRLWVGRHIPDETGVFEDPVFVIASGSLLRTSALIAVGGMREAFFIDYVDIDLCLRFAAAGRRSAVVGPALLSHRLGSPREHRLGTLRITTTNHSALRYYYMTRNRMRLWREWAVREPGWTLFDIVTFGYLLLRVTFYERDRPAKLTAVLRGALHGLFVAPANWKVRAGNRPVGSEAEREPTCSLNP